MKTAFSWPRFVAVLLKEFVQMRRDRLTFAMIVGIPIVQLLLFGYAINTDPKALPTAVVCFDASPYSRSFVASLENTGYFAVTDTLADEAEADRLLDLGEVQFVVVIPSDFSKKLTRGERPTLLVAADATDPSATGNALAALAGLGSQLLQHDLSGPLARLAPTPSPIDIRIQRRYNPEGITQYNIVPGLMGTILTMTMIMMTGLAMTRERERGTMENLLATPVRPVEVMAGKIAPFIIVGYLQVAVILTAARFLFEVPMVGSLVTLSVALVVFLAANLAVGFTFSTLAKNQLQAMQMTFFFFLPSILLSGFMFPFRGMPHWAQKVGEVFPLTHFLRIVRGILLKGNGFAEIGHELWPLGLFFVVAAGVALNRYRETLD
ncbi:ABC transporter permease [Crenobacter cavernae]|uniref:ABC transporter permease n=1 Tax=Crenobacter cavernae TaxID=2290923 RepID=A0A345Y9X5_9NEIS|nr:ABC transporter permease [Crenobacter cavernae]AXK40727.1 ABC transporter permease [Crenobacter cavernae]